MAQTLASTLNKPLDPFSVIGQVSEGTDITQRGRAARKSLEPLMRAEESAATQIREMKARGEESIADFEARQAKAAETGATAAITEYQTLAGEAPKRPVQQVNPNSLMELAALTAVLGGLAGATGGGRAALAAMEGISEGYKLGQQDIYERGIKDYQSALDSWKNNVQLAKNDLDNYFKLESVRKGSGAAEIKKFQARLNGTVAAAEASRGNISGAISILKDMIKTSDAAEMKLMSATEAEKRKEARSAQQASTGLEPPTYTSTIQLHSSGIPLAPLNPYVGVAVQKNMDAILQANLADARATFDRIRKEDDKNATKEAQMDNAEAALKRMTLKAFNKAKQEGKIPQNAVLNLETLTVTGANLPQVTGGALGLPIIGEFLQQILTSKDPDASLFRTEAANYQRGSYVPGEGQISNFERELFKQAAIDLGRPPLTNFELIRATREAARRQRDRKQFYEEYFAVNRTLQGAEQLWRAYSEANRFVTIDAAGNLRYNSGVPNYRTWFQSQQGREIGDITPQQQFTQPAPQSSTSGLTAAEEARYRELQEKQRAK